MPKHFVPLLAREPAVEPPLFETPDFSVYSGEFGSRFQLFSDLDSHLIRILREKDIAELEIFEPCISTTTDLAFLSELGSLKALSIHSAEPINWRPLQRLTHIVSLSLRTHNAQPQEIDFTQFENLERCKLNLHSEWQSILSVRSLRHLMIRETPTLRELVLNTLPNLQEFFLTRCPRVTSVEIEGASAFTSLGVSGCSGFRTLLPPVLLSRLKYLSLGGKSKFDYCEIGRCIRLVKLWLNGIGKVPTLKFLRACEDLEELQFLFSTNVVDGDLAFLRDLPNLNRARFVRRQHYYPDEVVSRFQKAVDLDERL